LAPPFYRALIGLFFLSKVREPNAETYRSALFLGALIAINNLDFGLPALAGMFVAICFQRKQFLPVFGIPVKRFYFSCCLQSLP
jgi:hypothetical protein